MAWPDNKNIIDLLQLHPARQAIAETLLQLTRLRSLDYATVPYANEFKNRQRRAPIQAIAAAYQKDRIQIATHKYTAVNCLDTLSKKMREALHTVLQSKQPQSQQQPAQQAPGFTVIDAEIARLKESIDNFETDLEEQQRNSTWWQWGYYYGQQLAAYAYALLPAQQGLQLCHWAFQRTTNKSLTTTKPLLPYQHLWQPLIELALLGLLTYWLGLSTNIVLLLQGGFAVGLHALLRSPHVDQQLNYSDNDDQLPPPWFMSLFLQFLFNSALFLSSLWQQYNNPWIAKDYIHNVCQPTLILSPFFISWFIMRLVFLPLFEPIIREHLLAERISVNEAVQFRVLAALASWKISAGLSQSLITASPLPQLLAEHYFRNNALPAHLNHTVTIQKTLHQHCLDAQSTATATASASAALNNTCPRPTGYSAQFFAPRKCAPLATPTETSLALISPRQSSPTHTCGHYLVDYQLAPAIEQPHSSFWRSGSSAPSAPTHTLTLTNAGGESQVNRCQLETTVTANNDAMAMLHCYPLQPTQNRPFAF